jgi:hypothetical protein
MVCRDAVVEDGIAIARVWVAAWQAAYAELMPAGYLAGLDAEAALPHFQRDLRANQSVLVLELDGDIVGFSRYGASRDPDAGPERGGDRDQSPSLVVASGTGRELLRETQQRLRGRGFSEATLWVLHGNASARQFYEAQSWRLDGVEKHDDTLTGFALHEVRYRVALV